MKKFFIIAAVVLIFACSACGARGEAHSPESAEKFWQSDETGGEVVPSYGESPLNLTGIEILGRLYQAFSEEENYVSETTGSVKAKVFGLNYTQTVYNKRYKLGEKLLVAATSKSSLVNVAEERYYSAGEALIRRQTSASKINGDDTEWKGSPERLSYAEYVEKYGLYPTEPTDHIVDEDTVLSAECSAFEGGYRLEVSLDADKSTEYYKRQVKTMASAGDYPKFKSVSLVYYFGGDFRIARADISEVYEIKKFGNITCRAAMSVAFAYGKAEEKRFAYYS